MNYDIQKYLTVQSEGNTSTRMFFYQRAQNCLIKIFNAKTLTRGLGRMQNHYLQTPSSPIHFMQLCQNEEKQKGNNWTRSQQTKDLYKAISNITFEKNKDGFIDVSCLINLEKAVDRYINPPKDKAQLEKDLFQYKREYNECAAEIGQLEAPINEVESFLRDMIGEIGKTSPAMIINKLIGNKQVLLNLDQCIENKNILLNIDKNRKIIVTFDKQELTVINENQNFYLDFNDKKMTFGLNNQFKEKIAFEIKADEIDKKNKQEFKILDEDDVRYYLAFSNQKVTYTINDQEVLATIENPFYSSDDENVIENQELILMIENQKVRLNFKNQLSKIELDPFIRFFDNKTVIHVFCNKNMVPINKVIGNIKGFLKKINHDRLVSLVNLMTSEKVNEIMDSLSLILRQIATSNEMDFSSNSLSQALYHIKPQLEKLKVHVTSLLTWYSDNVDNSFKITIMIYMINSGIDLIISKCDASYITSLQNSIDDKIETMKEINVKSEATMDTLQPVLNTRKKNIHAILQNINLGKKGLPNKHYMHWNVKELSPIQDIVQQSINFICLADISEIATQLVLSRNGITNKIIEPYQDGLNVIDHENGNYTVIVKNCLRDIESKDAVEAIIVTEYCIDINKNKIIPTIELMNDKIILCHENASDIFSMKDACIQECYNADLNDINTVLKNDLMLKHINNQINCMDRSPDKTIKQIRHYSLNILCHLSIIIAGLCW